MCAAIPIFLTSSSLWDLAMIIALKSSFYWENNNPLGLLKGYKILPHYEASFSSPSG
jgi:hypothetical protein